MPKHLQLTGDTMQGDLNLGGFDVPQVGSLGLDTTYSGTGLESVGTTYWDKDYLVPSTVVASGVRLQHGLETWVYGKNTSGAPITNGQAVSVVASNGQFTAFGLTNATNVGSAYAFIGLATEDIAINGFGRVTINGLVNDINTDNLVEGRAVYVDASTPGALTSTYPSVPNYVINVGVCERKHLNVGRINVLSRLVPKLADLSDINGTPLTVSGMFPVYQGNNYFDFTANVAHFPTLSGTNIFYGQQILAGNAFLTLSGTATTWNDLRIEPVARNTGANAPTFGAALTVSGSRGVWAYEFDNAAGGSEKEVMFSMQMPHDWKIGSPIHLHVHWFPKTAGTTSAVEWGLEYTVGNIGAVYPNPVFSYVSTNVQGDADLVANKHYISAFAEIDMRNCSLSTVLMGRLFRNSANSPDTFTGVADLLYIDAHYEVDSTGSREEYIK